MNDTNNNISENNLDTVKIEYINPLNPNEVLNFKNNTNVEVKEEINIEENNLEIKQDDSDNKENIEISENSDELIEANVAIKHKGKKKLLMIIVVLIVLAIILAAILLIPKIFKDDEKTPVEQPQVQEQNKISLQNIITNATNNTYYNFLTSTYTVNINEANNSIIYSLNSIDQTNPINKQIVFELRNRDLVITLNTLENNTDSLNIIYSILDSIGQYYGHDIDEVGNYMYSMQNNYNFNTTGIVTNNIVDPTTGLSTGMVEVLINIDTNITTTALETMSFTIDELNLYKNDIVNTSIDLKKGDLILYTNNSNVYTILIGQRKELNSNTYNTINSVIELLYPEEINDFKSKFTSLSTISFDKYKITVDPVLDANTYTNYQSNYKFILIEITKQA